MFWIVLIIFIATVVMDVDSLIWQAALIGIGATSWYFLGTLSYVVIAVIVIGIKIKNRKSFA